LESCKWCGREGNNSVPANQLSSDHLQSCLPKGFGARPTFQTFFCLAWLNTMPCALSSSPLHRGCCGDVGRFTSGGLASSAARTEALQLCLNGETVSRRCRPDVPSALRLLHASPPSAFAHIFSRLLHRFARFLSASFRVATGYKRPPPLDIATTAARNLPSAFTKTCRVAL
jgi:hypothetical protein